MKIRRYCYLVATILLHFLCLATAAKRPFFAPQKTQILHSPLHAALNPVQGYKYKGHLSKIGSRPPNCEHKCGRCRPCVAIQVPTTTTTTTAHLGVQYANYEPEGWKCKCGTIVFDP